MGDPPQVTQDGDLNFQDSTTGYSYTSKPLYSSNAAPSRPKAQSPVALSYGGAADAGDVLTLPDWSWQAWASALWYRMMSDPAIAFALSIFMTHRLLLFALGACLAPLAPIEPPLGLSLLRDVDPHQWGFGFFLLGPWQRWDTNWYLHISMFGYSAGDGSTNFPPLYPLMVGLLGRVLLEQYMLAAMLISNLAYIFVLVYLYRLSVRLFNVEAARRSVLFMATFPTAFFLASGYTESLYLALVLAAFYYAEERRWWLVAILSALASFTRLQGFVLVIPLGYLYMQQLGWNWRKIGRDGILLALSPGSLGLYLVYVYGILRDYNFNDHLQEIWHIRFVMPWTAFFSGLFGFFDYNQSRNLAYNALDFILLIVFIAMCIVWFQKKLPVAYLIYSVLSLAVFLTRQGVEGFFWMSMNRYLLSIFPVFMLAGQIGPRFLIKFGSAVQAVWAVLFIFWMWAG